MKIQFKEQKFQLDAVNSVVNIFQGQSRNTGVKYLMDPGKTQKLDLDLQLDAFRNSPIEINQETIKKKVNSFQTMYGIQPSQVLSVDKVNGRIQYNFSIEMETGVGKTYTYIRTIMELNRKYGWLKFIIVVPSVAIREGVLKSFQMMDDHFQMEYGKKPRYFVYDSKKLSEIDTFANSSEIRVMIINSQAFNATGKDARRIHMEQESFRWRKPIDVIAAMNPILIIDEPQSVEGKKTKERLKDFKPLFTLRYSATHKEKYDMVYRLDAMDAYNKKLVKKIGVKAIEKSGTTGTEGYLYLQELIPARTRPKAKVEFEYLSQNGVKRTTKIIEEPFDLYEESGRLEAYKGWTLHTFDAREGANSIMIGPNRTLEVGEVIGDISEEDLRILQIRETIKSHLEKEEKLYKRGIKVLSLFFIDEVAKYKLYDSNGDPYNGTYAETFEREYETQINLYLQNNSGAYADYLKSMTAQNTHAGYFSIDKNKKTGKEKFVDSKVERGTNESADADAYDLIMKNKEKLLSFEEPVRFLFSHSALKEGWDNPNVFQICTLKQSTAETRKRQEIGRGMRLCVDKNGVRQDEELLGAEVHDINRLTIIANESYENFSRSLQNQIKEILSDRPMKVDAKLFTSKILTNDNEEKLTITENLADTIYFEMVSNKYVDRQGQLTEKFFEDQENGTVKFPEEVAGFEGQVLEVINSIYDMRKYQIENENDMTIEFAKEINEENLHKKEFLELWNRINHKSVYTVSFDDEELVGKCVKSIDQSLNVSRVVYRTSFYQADKMTIDGHQFVAEVDGSNEEVVEGHQIGVEYDLLGEIADITDLTRKTVADILTQIRPDKFDMYKQNPEDFILKVGKLINEQKATQIIKHIEYNILEDKYDTDVFTDTKERAKKSDKRLLECRSGRGIYNYVKVDSDIEAAFQEKLDSSNDVKVYVKLPRAFKISTPVGNYNPDWALAFREGSVKHVYFVAETKGSMSTMNLKSDELAKIECARAHFRKLKESGIIDEEHVYDVVDSYESLMAIVHG